MRLILIKPSEISGQMLNSVVQSMVKYITDFTYLSVDISSINLQSNTKRE